MRKSLQRKIHKETNKFAAISAIWFALIIASAFMFGDSDQFVLLLPLLCAGGFLSVLVELYMK